MAKRLLFVCQRIDYLTPYMYITYSITEIPVIINVPEEATRFTYILLSFISRQISLYNTSPDNVWKLYASRRLNLNIFKY